MSRVLPFCDRLYRTLLLAYPAAFRRAYGEDMAQVFRDVCRDTVGNAGIWGLVCLWPVSLWDVLLHAAQEHLYQALRRSENLDTKLFDQQLGSTVKSMTTLLRAGYSVLQAFDMIATQSPEPVSSTFKRVLDEIQAGKPAPDALADLKTRVNSPHLTQVVDTMLQQRQTGGNLADQLDPIASAISQAVGEDMDSNAMLAHFRELTSAPEN
jgi:Flp pilus assembly protein TadB